mgnify:CR=1 FL=1
MKLAEKILENKGRHSNLSNPVLKKAYGVETFGELWDKISSDKDWKKFIKNEKIHGWIIDNKDSVLPFKLVSKTGIYGVGKRGDELVNMSAKHVFNIDELS